MALIHGHGGLKRVQGKGPLSTNQRYSVSRSVLSTSKTTPSSISVRDKYREMPVRSFFRPSESLTQRRDLYTDLEFDCSLETDDISDMQFSDGVSERSTPNSLSSNSMDNFQSPQMTASSQHHETPPVNREEGSSIVGMLQEQQALLCKLLSEQEKTTEAVKKNDHRIALLEANVNEQKSSSSMSSSCSDSGTEKKRLITKDLTDKVAKIHNVLEEGLRPEESSLSTHNAAVKASIVREICDKENSKYTEKVVKVAVQRKYEALRRIWKMQEDDKEEALSAKRKEKKYKARRQRKFDNRSLVVTAAERERWSAINVEYMSEELDDTESESAGGGHIVVRKQQWRSKTLCDFLEKLDQRYDKKVKKDGTAMARKERRTGSPLTNNPPYGAPSWAVAPEWRME